MKSDLKTPIDPKYRQIANTYPQEGGEWRVRIHKEEEERMGLRVAG